MISSLFGHPHISCAGPDRGLDRLLRGYLDRAGVSWLWPDLPDDLHDARAAHLEAATVGAAGDGALVASVENHPVGCVVTLRHAHAMVAEGKRFRVTQAVSRRCGDDSPPRPVREPVPPRKGAAAMQRLSDPSSVVCF